MEDLIKALEGRRNKISDYTIEELEVLLQKYLTQQKHEQVSIILEELDKKDN